MRENAQIAQKLRNVFKLVLSILWLTSASYPAPLSSLPPIPKQYVSFYIENTFPFLLGFRF
jgi:hypothetical protein